MEREPGSPGWYTSARAGFVQYHDGQRWTDEYYPAKAADPTANPTVAATNDTTAPAATETTKNAFTRRPRHGVGLAGMWHALVTRPFVTLAIATPAAVAVFVLEAWDPNRVGRDRYGLWVFVAALLPGLVVTVCQQKVPRWLNATYLCAVGFGITVAYVVLILKGIGKLSTL